MKALLPGETTADIIQKTGGNCNPNRLMQPYSGELLHACAYYQELRIKRGRDTIPMTNGREIMSDRLTEITQALTRLRAPLCQGEYDLHALVAGAFQEAGIPFLHEERLGPRCRIDFLAGTVGIEVKKGKPVRRQLLRQLERYAKSARVEALVVVVERAADLPGEILGKPCFTLSMNRLWGIAL
jgi:hypothetical protein